jgi:hypothetical protein
MQNDGGGDGAMTMNAMDKYLLMLGNYRKYSQNHSSQQVLVTPPTDDKSEGDTTDIEPPKPESPAPNQ